MTANEVTILAENMLASNYLHSNIMRIYNSISPLPSGYKLKQSDSWCAAFVSSVFWKASSGTFAFPYECSCGRMIERAKAMNIWCEDDSITPNSGYVILYDWNDSGKGDNTGWADHVGIVTKVTDKTITVIEGNYNGAIGKRTIKVNAKYIRGYIIPHYTEPKPKKKRTSDIVLEVIRGEWGVGKKRRMALENAGYDYSEIQSKVNEAIKKLSL